MSKMSELHAAVAQAEALESEPIITNAMLRAQDQARIAELEGLLLETLEYVLPDEPLADDSPDGDLVKRIRAALTDGEA